MLHRGQTSVTHARQGFSVKLAQPNARSVPLALFLVLVRRDALVVHPICSATRVIMSVSPVVVVVPVNEGYRAWHHAFHQTNVLHKTIFS